MQRGVPPSILHKLRVLLVTEARAEEEFVEAIPVATLEADRVVGLGGAFHPVRWYGGWYSTQCVRHTRGYGTRTAYVRVAPWGQAALRLCYVQHTRGW